MSNIPDVNDLPVNEVLELLGVPTLPAAAVKPVLSLLSGIIGVATAGDDAAKRLDALMTTAEKLKAHLDDAKFGPASEQG